MVRRHAVATAIVLAGLAALALAQPPARSPRPRARSRHSPGAPVRTCESLASAPASAGDDHHGRGRDVGYLHARPPASRSRGCPRSAGSRASSVRRATHRSSSRCGCRPRAGTGSSRAWATAASPGRSRTTASPRAVERGYAAASTDTGHKGSGIDATWALGHPEKIVDFGHRAIHEMTVKAKAVVAALLRRGPAPLVLRLVLERRPAGADGGAALPRRLRRHRRRRAGRGVDDVHVRASSGTRRRWPTRQRTFLPPSCRRSRGRWSRPATRATACPTACSLSPRRAASTRARSSARAADSADCLTAPQAEALAKVYAGPRARDGRVLAPRLPARAPRRARAAGASGSPARRRARACRRSSPPSSAPTWCSTAPTGTCRRSTSSGT